MIPNLLSLNLRSDTADKICDLWLFDLFQLAKKAFFRIRIGRRTIAAKKRPPFLLFLE